MSKNNQKQEIILNSALVDKTYHDSEAVEAIKDVKLKQKINAFIAAESKAIKSSWEMAKLLLQMSPLIKKDFGSDAEFAAFMDSTQSHVNKLKRVAEHADFFITEGYTVGNACELLPIFGKDGVNNSIKAKMIIKEHFNSSYTQSEIRAILQGMTFRDNDLLIMEKDIDDIREEKQIARAEKKAEKAKKLEDKKAGKTNKLKVEKKGTISKTEPTYEYVLPWLDGKDLIDKTLSLTENQAKDLAEQLMKLRMLTE